MAEPSSSLKAASSEIDSMHEKAGKCFTFRLYDFDVEAIFGLPASGKVYVTAIVSSATKS